MTELVKITERGGQQVVSARDLHVFLESKQRFSDWIKNRIEKYNFIEGQDFQKLYFDVEGNQLIISHHKNMVSDNQEVIKPHKIEYVITIDMAKELSMLENNEKGKQARQYFIECEKKLKQLVLPRNYKEALQHLIAQVEINEKLLLENEQMRPKADFYDTIIEVGKNVDMGEVAKLLNKGLGRNKLFELLRSKKILMNNNLPYQKYVDLGYFEVVEISKPKANGDLMVFTKTLVTQKGLDFINKVTN